MRRTFAVRDGLPAKSDEDSGRRKMKKPASGRLSLAGFLPRCDYSGLTFAAAGPFWPWVTSKETFWPSLSDL